MGRLAICISGNMRSFRMCGPSMFERVVAGRPHDVFIHTWSMLDHRGEDWAIRHSGLEHVSANDIAEIYSPVELVIEESPNEPPGPSPSNMFKKVFLADELRRRWSERTGISHDVVMRMRPDLLFTHDFPWNDYDTGALHIPHGEDHGGLNDQLAWGPPRIMEHYCSLGSSKTGDDHPERTMSKHIGGDARRPWTGYRIVRMAEADANGFVKRPTVRSLSPNVSPHLAPRPEVRPTDTNRLMSECAQPLRDFWTADRYAGNRDGIDELMAGVLSLVDPAGKVGLVVEPTDKTRQTASSKFLTLGWCYPFGHDDLHLDVPDAAYDVVVLLGMQHVPSRTARDCVMRECVRSLRPGGTLVTQMGLGDVGAFTHYSADGKSVAHTLCHVAMPDAQLLLDDMSAAGLVGIRHEERPPGHGDGQPRWLFAAGTRPEADCGQPEAQA